MCAMPQPPVCREGQLYTIARGDTLFLLAQRFNVTVEAIRAANPQLTNPNVLVIGQQICIPRAGAPPEPPPIPLPTPLPMPPACPEGRLHTVAAGETLFSIANRYGQALGRVIAANPQLTDPNVLVPGQVICIPIPGAGPPEIPPPPPVCAGGTIVTVAAGETMSTIARRFGLGLQQLIAANPQVIDPNILIVGQRLCVPVAPPVPPAPPAPPACPVVYTVVAGESMSAIARRFNVELQALIRANPQITDPNLVVPGQRICIPIAVPPGTPPPPACTGGTLYTVAPGETIFLIARRFGVTVDQLTRANPQITNPNLLVPGQRLCIPAAV